MTIFELGALGEFLGAILLLVSLAYVGLQIRQNTAATKAQILVTGNQFLAQTYLNLMESPNMQPILHKMIDKNLSLTALTEEEAYRWHCWLLAVLIRTNGTSRLYKTGYLNLSEYQTDMNDTLSQYKERWEEVGMLSGLELAEEKPPGYS